MAVQRIRLWASTAHCSHAELAWKLPEGMCSSPAPSFEVADGELDDGVVSVEPVDVDGVTVEVGQEGVVTPVGPQPQLDRVGEAGAPHDQSAGHLAATAAGGVGTLGDLGLTVGGVVDLLPGVLGNFRDRRSNALRVGAHGHRVTLVQPPQGGDRVVGPEP